MRERSGNSNEPGTHFHIHRRMKRIQAVGLEQADEKSMKCIHPIERWSVDT